MGKDMDVDVDEGYRGERDDEEYVYEERNWGQCDLCQKWRTLWPGAPAWPDTKELTCNMNTWDISRASCAAAEEEAAEESGSESEIDEVSGRDTAAGIGRAAT